MSTPPSVQQSPQSKRKKRPVEDVSFEDLLAAHKTEREPGQLPREGVVLIGVDIELQRRMAERVAFPAPTDHPTPSAPTIGAPNSAAPDGVTALGGAPLSPVDLKFGAPMPDARDLDAVIIGAPVPD